MESKAKLRTYGARFLDELKAQLHSTMGLKYAAIQLLERADREEFGRILRRELTGLTYAANRMMENEEPEVFARWLAQELREQANASAATAAAFFISG